MDFQLNFYIITCLISLSVTSLSKLRFSSPENYLRLRINKICVRKSFLSNRKSHGVIRSMPSFVDQLLLRSESEREKFFKIILYQAFWGVKCERYYLQKMTIQCFFCDVGDFSSSVAPLSPLLSPAKFLKVWIPCIWRFMTNAPSTRMKKSPGHTSQCHRPYFKATQLTTGTR